MKKGHRTTESGVRCPRSTISERLLRHSDWHDRVRLYALGGLHWPANFAPYSALSRRRSIYSSWNSTGRLSSNSASKMFSASLKLSHSVSVISTPQNSIASVSGELSFIGAPAQHPEGPVPAPTRNGARPQVRARTTATILFQHSGQGPRLR